MPIIDSHCDVLWKLSKHPDIDFFDEGEERLDVNYSHMLKSEIILQFFAIYLSEEMQPHEPKHYFQLVDLIYSKILSQTKLALIRSKKDLIHLCSKPHTQKGALLTIEGVDGLYGDFLYTRTLYHLGVRIIGLTWNDTNWAADGVMETRSSGISKKGKQYIRHCNELGIIFDVSHLSESSFWDVVSESSKPVIASHSNVSSIFLHPRNLTDQQVQTIIKTDGRIGMTYVPWFITDKRPVEIDHLLLHIEHVASLGGENQLVLGSDFDGIEEHIPELKNAGQLQRLIDRLTYYYSDTFIDKITYRNWYDYLIKHLPEN